MKVSIVPGTKKEGLIFKKQMYTVTFSATMSEEEKAKVRHARLEKEAVLEAPIRPDFLMELSVSSFMEGKEWTCTFARSDYAQQFTAILKDTLRNTKEYIDNIEENPQAQSFEL